MRDYDNNDYWFDIDDLGSSTITGLAYEAVRTQNNLIECKKYGNEVSCNTDGDNDRKRSLVGKRDHIRIEVTLDIDYNVATDVLRISVPPANKNYEGLAGVTSNYIYSGNWAQTFTLTTIDS